MRISPAKLSPLIAGFLKLLGATYRLKITGEGVKRLDDSAPVILVFWHMYLLPMPMIYHRMSLHRKLTTLTSLSNDGELMANVLQRFNIECARGGSSKGAVRGAKALIAAYKNGNDLIITPDGPRGPALEAKPGAMRIAQKLNAEILPVQLHIKGAMRTKSWDRMWIPLPFARIYIQIDAPIQPDTLDDLNQLTEVLGGDN